MSVSIEQAAANLAAALESGSAGDAESALASYADAIDGVEDVPEADNGPLKRDLNPEPEAEEAEAEVGAAAEAAASAESEGLAPAVEDLDTPDLSLDGVAIDDIADAELANS